MKNYNKYDVIDTLFEVHREIENLKERISTYENNDLSDLTGLQDQISMTRNKYIEALRM